MVQEHAVLEELRQLAPEYFRTLKHSPEKGDYVVSLHRNRYQHLLETISDFLKLCMVATEEGLEISTDISRLNISVHNTLGLVLRLLPVHESEFMDMLRDHLLEE